jgi:hypothetical protein
MIPKQDFRRMVEEQIKDTDPKDVRAAELALKMFGFVGEDFDLAGQSADLLTEQAAAFYDYKRKRLFLVDSTTDNAEQRMALVHELAHALADQHHSLAKYVQQSWEDDDAVSARQAVMEGQATWLTWAYLSKQVGGPAEVPSALLDRVASLAGGEGAEYPVLTGAPMYIRESLLFPYTQGTRFQDAVYRKLGKAAFDEVFRRPPVSTQQILHPEAYPDTVPASPDTLPRDQIAGQKEARRFRLLLEGKVGEFDHSVLLRQYAGPETAAAASHWRGGAFHLYEHKAEKYPLLAYVSEWDSAGAARTYFDLYLRVLRGKWKTFEIAAQSDTEVSGKGDRGRFVLRLDGVRVHSVEGLR